MNKNKLKSFGKAMPEANLEFAARRTKRLRENKAALAWLNSAGINNQTIKSFFLGLSEEYLDTKKTVHENALIAPIISQGGKPASQSVYFNIPSVTVNPNAGDYWARGEARTYYSEAFKQQLSVFVCPKIWDLWHLHQFSDKAKQKPRILFIASSKHDSFPDEWYQPDFWARFENIYLGYPNDAAGDKISLKIAKFVGQTVKRVRPPGDAGRGWSDFCRNAGEYEQFNWLLSEAAVIGVKISKDVNGIVEGRFGYEPVDIAGAYHNGHLYYPIKTIRNVEEKYRDENGKSVFQITTRTEVVLIRSDRSIQTVCEVPAPRGTPLDERVLRLSDGTLIESRPKSSAHSTWSWKSIQKFCSGKSKTRPLRVLLSDVKDFLKKSVWLPFEPDYDLLALLVPVTFAQVIFQSVPLVLVAGAPGTGKTALGKAMAKVCANAATVGQISAAAVARLIDETKGFVVFDDLESVGKRKGRDAAHFNELIQALKLSYNKETCWKSWTDVSRGMSVKRLNFYGVKMINNTTGTDHILGSRALKIYTRKMPAGMQSNFEVFDAEDEIRLSNLRDELHTWTFKNVGLIDQTYQRLFPVLTDRKEEIAAPLRVFADLSEDEELKNGLNAALEFQDVVSDESVNPVALMKEAVKRLVASGQTEISSTQVLSEMKNLLYKAPFPSLLEEISQWESPVWVGRQLRIHKLIQTNSPPTRQFLDGKYIRMYPLEKSYINEIRAAR